MMVCNYSQPFLQRYVAHRRWQHSDILAAVVAAVAYCADAVSLFPYEEHHRKLAAATGFYPMVMFGGPVFAIDLSLLTATFAMIPMRPCRPKSVVRS